MLKIPDIYLELIKTDGIFILKDNFMDVIQKSLVDIDYLINNTQENYENMLDMIKEQTTIFLKYSNSRKEDYDDNNNIFSGIISVWSDEEQRSITIFSLTLTYTNI